MTLAVLMKEYNLPDADVCGEKRKDSNMFMLGLKREVLQNRISKEQDSCTEKFEATCQKST